MIYWRNDNGKDTKRGNRLFKIIYHLVENGKSTAPELSKKLKVSVITIYGDMLEGGFLRWRNKISDNAMFQELKEVIISHKMFLYCLREYL